MDTSEQYIKMCEKADEIQELLESFSLEQFPIFALDRITERKVVVIWAPKTLQERLNFKGNSIIVSIEPAREKNQFVPEYPGNWHDSLIWLPRQDQLQEILPEFIAKVGFVPSIASHFADFVCSNEVYPFPFDTFEKSWLAFVMKEKYGKVWDYEKEDWVKAKKKEGVSRS